MLTRKRFVPSWEITSPASMIKGRAFSSVAIPKTTKLTFTENCSAADAIVGS
jgi:hypothetical protein